MPLAEVLVFAAFTLLEWRSPLGGQSWRFASHALPQKIQVAAAHSRTKADHPSITLSALSRDT